MTEVAFVFCQICAYFCDYDCNFDADDVNNYDVNDYDVNFDYFDYHYYANESDTGRHSRWRLHAASEEGENLRVFAWVTPSQNSAVVENTPRRDFQWLSLERNSQTT